MQGSKIPDILNAEFLVSSPDVSSCPEGSKPEYAFIGRSNVGKSSLINMISGIKGLAKTSQTPGKTRLLNYFVVDDEWYLVDLPGYGYAKISQREREKWRRLIHAYLRRRENLVCTFILIDSRHEPQKLDLDFMAWMAENQLPFVLVFTKTDKLSKRNLENSLNAYIRHLHLSWEEIPRLFITSAKTSRGKDEILRYIQENNKLYMDYLASL
ncbi:MAG: ribosome biogenesis GTP-binding protein YihA/YsxC [Bacteroidales bacterium]|jgi:GTP-binding protein|nr:ribosome biogenesis GTP-binding protein YihA/YsxC [Bacteroidales bacterium]